MTAIEEATNERDSTSVPAFSRSSTARGIRLTEPKCPRNGERNCDAQDRRRLPPLLDGGHDFAKDGECGDKAGKGVAFGGDAE